MRTKEKFLNIVIIISIIIIIITVFIIRPVRVDGSSMETTYYNGNYVLINQLQHDYSTGEIVVFKSPIIGEDYLIKRIIGIENDLIEIIQNKVYVNGIELKEIYISSEWDSEDLSISVPKNEVFLMGDNRENSYDSRDFGTVSTKDIIGYVI